MSLAGDLRTHLIGNAPLINSQCWVDAAPKGVEGIFVIIETLPSEALSAKGEHLGETERIQVRTWFDVSKGEDGDAAHAQVALQCISFAGREGYSYDGAQLPVFEEEINLTVGECYLSGFTQP